MPLTPIDVQQKTFGTALRGYDLDEVDDFLDDVVTSLKDYDQRLRDAQERIATLEMEMTDRGDAEGAIARALVAAQRSADAIVEEARAEAERIVNSAQVEASEMSRRRDDEKDAAEAEINRIRAVVDDLRGRLRDLSAMVGVSLDQADSTLTTAAADLNPEEGVEVAVTEADELTPSWEEPAALDEIDEFTDPDETESAGNLEEVSYEAEHSPYRSDDNAEAEEGEEQVDRSPGSLTPDWARSDGGSADDDHPVRPWEIS